MDPILQQVRYAVVAVCEGRLSDAEQALHAIDLPELSRNSRARYARVWGQGGLAAGFQRKFPGTKRRNPGSFEKQATFIRDHYTCRYSHCRRPTVSVDVLRLLSKIFPDLMPYHPNWKGRERHILYYTYSTNLEHLRSFTEIGPSAAVVENLITACYECGDTKGDLPIELLGWHVSEPPVNDWAGLTEYIPRLETAIAALAPPNIVAAKEPQRPVAKCVQIENG